MDWGAIRKIAFGPLNLTPEKLGTLTHGEFLDMYEGHQWRERRQLEHYAQLASWVTAPHLKRPLDPSKLLQPKEAKKGTVEDREETFAHLSKLLGGI